MYLGNIHLPYNCKRLFEIHLNTYLYGKFNNKFDVNNVCRWKNLCQCFYVELYNPACNVWTTLWKLKYDLFCVSMCIWLLGVQLPLMYWYIFTRVLQPPECLKWYPSYYSITDLLNCTYVLYVLYVPSLLYPETWTI